MFFIQFLGFVGNFLSLLANYQKTRRLNIILKLIGTIFNISHFYLLDTSFIAPLIGVGYFYLYLTAFFRDRPYLGYLYYASYPALLTLSFFDFKGTLGDFALTFTLLTDLIAYNLKNIVWIKIITFVGYTTWALFNYSISSWPGVIFSIMNCLAILISLYQIRNAIMIKDSARI